MVEWRKQPKTTNQGLEEPMDDYTYDYWMKQGEEQRELQDNPDKSLISFNKAEKLAETLEQKFEAKNQKGLTLWHQGKKGLTSWHQDRKQQAFELWYYVYNSSNNMAKARAMAHLAAYYLDEESLDRAHSFSKGAVLLYYKLYPRATEDAPLDRVWFLLRDNQVLEAQHAKRWELTSPDVCIRRHLEKVKNRVSTASYSAWKSAFYRDMAYVHPWKAIWYNLLRVATVVKYGNRLQMRKALNKIFIR